MITINTKLENQANDILLKNDMLRIPVDLLSIANNNDIEVYEEKLPTDVSGCIRYNTINQKFQIIINKDEPYNRRRFTLAHELAHYFLEKNLLLKNQEIHYDTLYRRNKNSLEEDIEYFAGALLMDRIMLEKLYKIYPSIPILAKTFKVSESALTKRLMVLGLV